MNQFKFSAAFLMVCGVLSAQAPAQDENAIRMAAGETPIYRVTVTKRTAKAINYQHRSGATKIDFKGTEFLPNARGEAKVEGKQGYIEIEVEFDNLLPASRNGAEYLTYVLWAITPEGRTSNLGELLLNGTKGKLNVTTELQVFGLVVTAEPYYAVSRPSDLIVMENVVRADTRGKIEEIDAKYELLQRGQYQRLFNPLALKLDRKVPLEVYEARNAVQIARAVGADRFAAETYQKAEKSLAQAEAYRERNAGSKPVTMMAREAVQTAEDARAIAVKRQEEDALNAERQASSDREARSESARLAANAETDRVGREAAAASLRASADAERLTREKNAQAASAQAEADRVKRQNDARMAAAGAEAQRLRADAEAREITAKAEADRLKRENDSFAAASGAEAQRLRADAEAREITAKAEADRLKRESDAFAAASGVEAQRLKSQSDAREMAAKAEADRLKRDNDAERASLAALNNAAAQKAQLLAEKTELRILLLKQFNAILQTRDSARGLIVNMSDVLFDTGKSSLRPAAREKLAKVSGIVSGHPGLRLDIEGFTDSVGTDASNQLLSEQRGASVRDYLVQQGMSNTSVASAGFGESRPVATNDTAQGRQQNRRVELVISGEVIGTEIGTPFAAR